MMPDPREQFRPDQVRREPLWNRIPEAGQWAIVIVGVTLACTVLLFAFLFGAKEFTRYQKRADAKNAITVTHTKIEVAKQQAKINRAQIEATKAEAEKRYQESIGIRKAQDEIAKTLTPLYVQHEAIQKLPQARAIYVPSGQQGIPQVYNVGERP